MIGKATANVDFASASGTMAFLDGEVVKTVQIIINDDQTFEHIETINLVLSNPTGGANLGLTSSANINITDNDVAATASIGGKVFYANTGANQPQQIVPGVAFKASSASAVSDTTDSAGAYQLENLTVGGQYDVAAQKTGDANGIRLSMQRSF